MKLFLAADHRGFSLKEQIKTYLSGKIGNSAVSPVDEVIDCGASNLNPEDDYVDFATQAIMKMGPADRIILLCGSGHGMDIVANRFPYIRAIMGFNGEVVKQGREHEDANSLVLPSDWLEPATACQFVDIFLNTPFSNEERHNRRLKKLSELK